VGRRAARAAAQLSEQLPRDWPLVVRRAREADRESVLSFASTTWDGWDYVPRAWPHWLAADDGVVLVATAGRTADGRPARDAAGAEIAPDRAVAVARVSLLAQGEAWLEGIRVDPAMRGLGVATDLQIAELIWAAASQAHVVRYATGERNEASHRLGARHGFRLLAAFRLWQWHARPPTEDDQDDEDVSGFDEEARSRANGVRRAVLRGLSGEGLIAQPADGDGWWARVSADSTFHAGRQLCEQRGWAMQRLTRELFDFHLLRGEVITLGEPAGDGPWALATLHGDAPPAEDADVKLGLLVGPMAAAGRLVDRVRRLAGESVGFWLPGGEDEPVDARDQLLERGFHPRPWALHVLARPIEDQHPLPEPDERLLVLAEPPVALRAPSFSSHGSGAG
jgi:RimJ/RimL family protein N-acetyltransferase